MYGDLFPDEFYKPYDPFNLYKWKSESKTDNSQSNPKDATGQTTTQP